MEFRELKYICTVAEYGNITKAAQALFVSQPSLSHFIARTEEKLGVQLFDRQTTPLRLTYAGEIYVQKAREIIQTSDLLTKEFRDISRNLKGRLRVGFPKERASYMLPLILPQFKAAYPGIKISTLENNGERLLDAVERGLVDFMILPIQRNKLGTDLTSVVLYEEELFLTVKSESMPSECLVKGSNDTVDLHLLSGKSFILLHKGHAARAKVDQLFRSYRIKPDIAMETESNTTAYRLSATGIGAAIVPALTINLSNPGGPTDIYHLGAERPVTWEVCATYKKDAHIGVVEQKFLDIASKVMHTIRAKTLS